MMPSRASNLDAVRTQANIAASFGVLFFLKLAMTMVLCHQQDYDVPVLDHGSGPVNEDRNGQSED